MPCACCPIIQTRWQRLSVPGFTSPNVFQRKCRPMPNPSVTCKPKKISSDTCWVEFFCLLRYRDRCALRRGNISCHFVLLHVVDHELIEHLVPASVELQRLIHGAVFLLYGLVIRHHAKVELAPLRIGLLEQQANGGNWRRRTSFGQCELVIIAVPTMLQEFQLVARSRDQSALHAQVAHGTF